MNDLIRIGTRGSQLAMWQANHVAAMLHAHRLNTQIVPIRTKGDKNITQSFTEMGTKGIFTEEIETSLLQDEIDIAVHSAKDMQSSLPKGLEIIAYMEREIPNDVLVSNNPEVNIDTIGQYIIGTSSARRKAMLQFFYPGIRLAESRGNLQTRILKMEEGKCDALILAYAGMHRMNYDHLIRAKLPVETFTPAVGQGSIAIECAMSLIENKKIKLKEILNHKATEHCLKAERAFLAELEGGCSVPLFCLATLQHDFLHLNAGIINTSATKLIRQKIQGPVLEAERLGRELAKTVYKSGGLEVLDEIAIEKT